jgi:hypothetical protein
MDTFDEESLHLQRSLDDEIELVRNHSAQVPHLGCGLQAAKLARVTGCFPYGPKTGTVLNPRRFATAALSIAIIS